MKRLKCINRCRLEVVDLEQFVEQARASVDVSYVMTSVIFLVVGVNLLIPASLIVLLSIPLSQPRKPTSFTATCKRHY